jgi:predicted acyltransferase (DUF342 family)
MSAFIVLLLLALVLFTLPLLPAVRELVRKTDATPLSVTRDHNQDIRHFARAFYQDMLTGMGRLTLIRAPAQTTQHGRLADGSRFQVVGFRSLPLMTPREKARATSDSQILSTATLTLTPGVSYSKAIYSEGNIRGGPSARYFALLGREDIKLGRNSVITDWAQARSNLVVGRHSQIHGRVAAGGSIEIGSGSHFKRAQAPHIRLGQPLEADPATTFPARQPLTLEGAINSDGGRLLFDGDLRIPPGAEVVTDLVVRGNLYIGANARIVGAVKAHGRVTLETQAVVDGSVVSPDLIIFGDFCSARGPLISETKIYLAKGTVIGSMKFPTTITAPTIVAEPGVTTHGTLWARIDGEVLDIAAP